MTVVDASARVRVGPLWIRQSRRTELGVQTRRKIDEVAAEIRGADREVDATAAFGSGVATGCGSGLGIWFGDIAEIPLMSQNPAKRFDYRLGWLAGPADIVVTGGPICPDFEQYQKRIIGAPSLSYLNVDPSSTLPRRATPTICLREAAVLDRLCGALAGFREVTLHAHITTGTIWALASQIANMTGVTVHVAGPPPRLSRLANDKLWFGWVVQRVLGHRAGPPKRSAYSGSALSRHVAELANRWDRLVLKVPDSAGSAGNLVVRAHEVRGLDVSSLREDLLRRLAGLGREPVFPMLVEVWDSNALTSPSVQTWIPLLGEGPPVIEGVFEQILIGEQASFVGAIPADLPRRIDSELCRDAMQLATLFQLLGYFGRCSFDALVIGPNIQAGTIHWIECNARWGGVSIPMSLVHRIEMNRKIRAKSYSIVQEEGDQYPPRMFSRILEDFSELEPTFDLQSGVLFLSPHLMEAGAGCHILSFGPDLLTAERQAELILNRMQFGM